MRYPGLMLGESDSSNSDIIEFIADQLALSPEKWWLYGNRKNTLHEHRIELQTVFGFKSFTMSIYDKNLINLEKLALKTDKGFLLATQLIELMRSQLILLPSINVIEKLCAEAIIKANRQIYKC